MFPLTFRQLSSDGLHPTLYRALLTHGAFAVKQTLEELEVRSHGAVAAPVSRAA
jgi:hypothetical protein